MCPRIVATALCSLSIAVPSGSFAGGVPPSARDLEGWWVVFARDIAEREWHATLRIDATAPQDDESLAGEFTWDTPATSASTIYGSEQFTGRVDPRSRALTLAGFELEDDRQIATAEYSAEVTPGATAIIHGRWTGETVRDSDFWHAVKASAAESTFEATTEGWLPVGSATLTWRDADGDRAGIGFLSSDGPGEISAPAAFLGDLDWRGRVPPLLSFAIRRTGPQRPGMKGPLVTVSGPAGAARFRVGNPAPDTWRTYVVPFWEGVWDVDEGARFSEILADVDTLIISPDGTRPAGPGNDGTQWFHLDDIRLLRPSVRPAPKVLEWRFMNDGPRAVAGSEVLEFVGEDPDDPAEFTTTDGASIPHIGDSPSPIALLPAFDEPGSSQGVELQLTTVPPNGGGQFVNRYTFVWDLLIPGAIGTGVPLVHTPPADAFARFDLGIQGFGPLAEGYFWLFGVPDLETGLVPDRWHRVVQTVDTIEGRSRVYVDGTIALEGAINGFDRRNPTSSASLASMDTAAPAALFFKDVEGLVAHEVAVSRIAFVDRVLSPDRVAALGGPDAGGALAKWIAPLAVERSGPASIDLDFSTAEGIPYRLQESGDLCLWHDLEFVPGTGTRERRTLSTATGSARFFRLIPAFD